MIFNRKTSGNQRASAPVARSPRATRLMQESWWLLVVAAIAYLALILASYTRNDPGFSYSGPEASVQNRGGVVGAWLSDLLLYLFGLSAWWWVVAGAVLIATSYRHLRNPEAERDHPFVMAAVGFGLTLFTSSAIEAVRLWRMPAALPQAPGGLFGEWLGGLATHALGFNGGTLLLITLFAVGLSLFTGLSWLRLMERIGVACERLVDWARRKRDERTDRIIGAQAAAERDAVFEKAREEVEERQPIVVVPPVTKVEKSERVVREKQRPLFTDMPDSPLPPLSLLEDAPPASETVSAETLEFTSRLIER